MSKQITEFMSLKAMLKRVLLRSKFKTINFEILYAVFLCLGPVIISLLIKALNGFQGDGNLKNRYVL